MGRLSVYNVDMSSGDQLPFDGNRQFATTRWSMVRAIRQEDPEASASALQELCQVYWYPLYSFVRRKGHDANEAADLTQAFFADLLERESLQDVDPQRGKFRSFLLKACQHFLSNQYDRQRAVKRGGGRRIMSLNFDDADQRYSQEPEGEQTPEKRFLQQWATTLLQRVERQLRGDYEKRGKAHQFDELRGFLAGKNPDETLAGAAGRLGMSEVAVKVAVHRLRQRFGEKLREEIGQTVDSEEGIDEEIRELFEVFRE